MRVILLGIVVACCLPITVIAGDRSVISSFLSDLDQDMNTLMNQLHATGYKESYDTAFLQAGMRVFMKAEPGTRPVVHILEQCNDKITGYIKAIASMDEVLLVNELKQLGYRKNNTISGEVYRKADITIDLYNDDSRPLLARRYIHVSRRNACHTNTLSSPLSPGLNLRPSSLDGALANLTCYRNEVAVAAAKRSFASTCEKEDANVVTYRKSLQTFRVKYCQNQVQHFEWELNEKDGYGLVESVEKKNFQKVKEDAADNKAFTRTYATEFCEVTIYYYGDKYGREFNENAYKVVLLNKRTCM